MMMIRLYNQATITPKISAVLQVINEPASAFSQCYDSYELTIFKWKKRDGV